VGYAVCTFAIYGEIRQEGSKQSEAGDARAQARHAPVGPLGQEVTSRKQAIAIGLSEARRVGGKVPRKRKGGKKR
jgi:hypothetical protein